MIVIIDLYSASSKETHHRRLLPNDNYDTEPKSMEMVFKYYGIDLKTIRGGERDEN